MNQQSTSRLLAALKAYYPQTFKPDDPLATANAWARFFQDISDKEASDALTRLVSNRTSAFAPTIGEIRREVMRARHPSLLITGEAAWAEVWNAVKSTGHTSQPEWSHPALDAAVEALGWRDICLTETSNLGTLRAQFMRIYEAKREHEETQAAIPEAIRISPPRPVSARLNQGHTTQAMAMAKREELPPPEPVSSPETFAENMATLMATIDAAKGPEPARLAQPSAKPVELTEEQRADPDYLPGWFCREEPPEATKDGPVPVVQGG